MSSVSVEKAGPGFKACRFGSAIYERGGKTEDEDEFLYDFKVNLIRLGILNPATDRTL